MLPTGHTADSAVDLAGKTNAAIAFSIPFTDNTGLQVKVTTCHTWTLLRRGIATMIKMTLAQNQ